MKIPVKYKFIFNPNFIEKELISNRNAREQILVFIYLKNSYLSLKTEGAFSLQS